MKPKASLYLRIRRFVYRDLSTRTRPATPMLGIFPIALAVMVQSRLSDTAAMWALIIAITISGAWTAFVWWRAYRLIKALGLRGDRQYDERDKFALAPEYHGSESATRAKQKRRISRRRER